MKNKFHRSMRYLVVVSLLISQLSIFSEARAVGNSIQFTFAAANPETYDHTFGGGQWNSGRKNVDILETLEGKDFACDETVSYLMKVDAPDTEYVRSLGAITLDMNYSITMDTTGQSGVALSDPVTVGVNVGDPANVDNSNSVASTVGTSQTGPMFSKGALLLKTFRLTGVEAGETIIYRFNVKIRCQLGSKPTGNLQVKFQDGAVAAVTLAATSGPSVPLSGGNETVSLKSVDALAIPSISLAKTVTTSAGTCPGVESITIDPSQSVKFCYIVTNDSNSGGQTGAALYNMSTIADDNGDFPGFDVPLTTGLTDIDLDGQVDDLAPGESASGAYITSFTTTENVTVINTATISGYSLPVDGSLYSATDTAQVIITLADPALSLNKLTNGSDGSTLLIGAPITWTYVVTNTGGRTLTGIYVEDNQGVLVVCPQTSLVPGEAMTCSGIGSAIAGNYANVGTVYGSWNSTVVSASDASSYFGAEPKIDIQKTPDAQTVIYGQTATFTITVTNTGNVDLTGVAVTDALSSDCDRIVGALAVGAVQAYTCTSPAITDNLINTAEVTGSYGTTQVSDSDSANVSVDFLPNISLSKSANPTSVSELGGNVTFTFSVKNNAPEDFILTSLTDDKFGDVNGQGTCSTPQTIAADSTYSCTVMQVLASPALTPHVNVATAEGRDPEGNTTSGSDDATVTFVDALPQILLSKSATPSVLPESGGESTFTFTVTNQTAEPFNLTSLTDDKFGDLNGKGTCVVPQMIAGLGSYSCTYAVTLGDWTTTPFDNTATATAADNEGNQVSDSDSFRITFTDLLPQVGLTKTATPNAISGVGDYVDYTFTISNTGPEAVLITSLIDPLIVLSPNCLALVGQTIAIGGALQCVTNAYLVIGAGATFTNTATVVVADNESNAATASASATVTSFWFGRSPGFWKNHSESWMSGYTPSMNIQSVFTIPSALLTGSNLDLDKNGTRDTLMAGLGYKGGSTLAGAAQILLRASVAALLNEAYYGAQFPAESSVSALIARVNSVLATQNRSNYLALATEYDKWNNGIHSPLP